MINIHTTITEESNIGRGIRLIQSIAPHLDPGEALLGMCAALLATGHDPQDFAAYVENAQKQREEQLAAREAEFRTRGINLAAERESVRQGMRGFSAVSEIFRITPHSAFTTGEES